MQLAVYSLTKGSEENRRAGILLVRYKPAAIRIIRIALSMYLNTYWKEKALLLLTTTNLLPEKVMYISSIVIAIINISLIRQNLGQKSGLMQGVRSSIAWYSYIV
jgi:flagellar biosynthesis protein FliP